MLFSSLIICVGFLSDLVETRRRTTFVVGLVESIVGQQLEPDDNKHLTYAGYSDHRFACRVL